MKLLIGILMLTVLAGCKSGGSSSSSGQEGGDSAKDPVNVTPEIEVPDQPVQIPDQGSVDFPDQTIPEVIPPIGAEPLQSYKLEIQWDRPSTRTDGTSIDLSDIKEYRIHFGREASNLTNLVEIEDSVNLTEVIELPAPGLWYISMTTIDSAGLESELSGAEPIFICEDSLCSG